MTTTLTILVKDFHERDYVKFYAVEHKYAKFRNDILKKFLLFRTQCLSRNIKLIEFF